MIDLRKFFVGLLALTTLVVAAYFVYEMTPERRERRVVSRMKTLYDEYLEDSEMEIREESYWKRGDKLTCPPVRVVNLTPRRTHRLFPLAVGEGARLIGASAMNCWRLDRDLC